MNTVLASSKKVAPYQHNSRSAGSAGRLNPESYPGRPDRPRRGWYRACAVVLLWAATAIIADANDPKGPPPPPFGTLVNFPWEGASPSQPVGALVQGMDGNFYGVTENGGTDNYGAIFSITPGGTLMTLHSFDGTDGFDAAAGLALGTDGNFYGTTYNGGNYAPCDSADSPASNCGTVFKITPTGDFTTLYNFDVTHGSNPSGLVQGFDGNFYGTTLGGGESGGGTVFKITSTGALTTVYNFCGKSGCPNDSPPNASALVQGTDGNFYGTTEEGGNHLHCSNVLGGTIPCGTVFKLTPGGTLTTLYSFCAESYCEDGAIPLAGLVLGLDGNFYGTTSAGGGNESGTVFKITPEGELTTLYSFCQQADCADGGYPESSLMPGSDGNFYGTTAAYGLLDYSSGTVFRITPAGVLTTLYSFEGTDDGDGGLGLVQSTNGIIFGITQQPVQLGGGTVFSLDEGLSPFVETLPMAGNAGSSVVILGAAVEGATSVKFDNTSATFKILSDLEIETTVPKGASTGLVQIPVAGGLLGTLKTKVPFTTPIP